MLTLLARWFLALWRWKVVPGAEPVPDKCVMIAAPHTSNWDFPVGMLAKWCCGVHINWIGKESLFRGVCGFLFGRILRSWGGEPIERHVQSGASAQLAGQELEQQHAQLVPERRRHAAECRESCKRLRATAAGRGERAGRDDLCRGDRGRRQRQRGGA